MSPFTFDTRVRLAVMDRFLASGRPPSVAETAGLIGESLDAVADAYRRLEEGRVLVLAPGTLDVWMANPLSAVPTAFRVETERGSYWGNCIWDALGIPPMLGADGTVWTACPDCGERMTFRVEGGELERTDAVIHFAVPAARWWDNIGFT